MTGCADMRFKVWWLVVLALTSVGWTQPYDYDDPGGGHPPPAVPCPAGVTKVTLSGMSYSPATLTVSPGTKVCWQDNEGFHSVLSDTGLFHSGTPADAVWSYSHVFSTAGTYPYHCEVHGNSGMRGTVVVTGPGGTSAPGVLKFSQASFSVSEAAASAAITVSRSNGEDGAVSVAWAAAAGTASAGSDFTAGTGTLSWANGDGTSKTFTVAILHDSQDEANETVNLSLSSPTGGATLDSVRKNATLTIQDNDAPPAPGTPPAAPNNLQAEAEENSVSAIHLSWADVSSNETEFRIERRTLTGAFEQIASVAAGTTGFSAEGESGVFYVFRVRAAGSEGTLSGFSNEAAAASNVTPGPCLAGSTTLCIHDGNFQVEARWRTATLSGNGFAVPVPSAPDSGLLYFFNPANIEALVKVLNGCSLNNHYWVFFAATTNVEFALTVTDTRTGNVKAYFNPLSQPAIPVQDTAAFTTCPQP